MVWSRLFHSSSLLLHKQHHFFDAKLVSVSTSTSSPPTFVLATRSVVLLVLLLCFQLALLPLVLLLRGGLPYCTNTVLGTKLQLSLGAVTIITTRSKSQRLQQTPSPDRRSLALPSPASFDLSIFLLPSEPSIDIDIDNKQQAPARFVSTRLSYLGSI